MFMITNFLDLHIPNLSDLLKKFPLFSLTGASAAGYMPYAGTYAALPQQGAFNGLTNLPYQNAAAAANASLQEARLQ